MLNFVSQKPKKIIFIDDKRNHVEDVEKTVMEQGIECIACTHLETTDSWPDPVEMAW